MKHIEPDLMEGLCLTPSMELGGGSKRSKFNFFQNMVILYIKLKRIKNAARW